MTTIRTWLLAIVHEAVKQEMDARDAAIERELMSVDLGAKGGNYDSRKAAHLRRIGAGSPLPPWPAASFGMSGGGARPQ